MKSTAPWVKPLLEYGPLLVFFAAFLMLRQETIHLWGREYAGVVGATLVFIPVQVLATAAQWWLTGRLSPMQVVTLVLVVGFGGLTVWLNDPRFFKMKPTLIYLLFAAVLGLGMMMRRNWLGLALGEAVPLRPEGWRILTRRLVLLFLGLAAANEFVWRTMSDTTWVSFKTFGLPLVILAFFVLNGGLIGRYMIQPDGDGKPGNGPH